MSRGAVPSAPLVAAAGRGDMVFLNDYLAR